MREATMSERLKSSLTIAGPLLVRFTAILDPRVEKWP